MPTLPASATTTLRQSASATLSSLRELPATLTSTALSIPHTYSTYVAANASSVSQIESGLRSLTYLLPGARLHDSELASESLHTFVQLLSIYHDHLLRGRAYLLSSSPTFSRSRAQPKAKSSLHLRYTDFWYRTSPLYTQMATVLKTVQYTELLLEMAAKRRGGERARWRLVVLLESFKALCRLILMRLTNTRPLVNPPLPVREEFAPAEEPEETAEEDDFIRQKLEEAEKVQTQPRTSLDALDDNGIPTPPLSDSGKTPANANSATNPSSTFEMPRTGFILPTLPSPTTSSISSYLLSHVITPDDIKPARQLLNRLTSLSGQAAETLHILRPVIYALLMQRVARRYGYVGRKWRAEWTPWVVGLSIEYLSQAMAKKELDSRRPGGRTELEREELKKRVWQMSWWGMRGAFYENVTGRWVKGVVEALKGKPLLDLVGTVVEDYEILFGEYYFTSATM